MAERRLGQDEQYFTVREVLAEASRVADAFLSRERSDFYRFGFAALGFTSFHLEPSFPLSWRPATRPVGEEFD